jgi:hypothetical protein
VAQQNAPSGEVRLARGLDAPSGEVRLARGLDAPSGEVRLSRGLNAPSGEVRLARGPPRARRPRSCSRALLTVNSCIKVRLDLQADKSPVVVKGPFFPRVVNPMYRIRGTNV